MGYEQMANQFGDAKRAVNYLPRSMQRNLGQSPEDLSQVGTRLATVTKAIEAGAAKLENPKPVPAPAPAAVSVNVPYLPTALGIGIVVGLYLLIKK